VRCACVTLKADMYLQQRIWCAVAIKRSNRRKRDPCVCAWWNRKKCGGEKNYFTAKLLIRNNVLIRNWLDPSELGPLGCTSPALGHAMIPNQTWISHPELNFLLQAIKLILLPHSDTHKKNTIFNSLPRVGWKRRSNIETFLSGNF